MDVDVHIVKHIENPIVHINPTEMIQTTTDARHSQDLHVILLTHHPKHLQCLMHIVNGRFHPIGLLGDHRIDMIRFASGIHRYRRPIGFAQSRTYIELPVEVPCNTSAQSQISRGALDIHESVGTQNLRSTEEILRMIQYTHSRYPPKEKGDGRNGPSPRRKQTNNAWRQALDQTVSVQRVSYERIQYAQRWKRRRGDPTVSVHSMSWQSKPVKLRTNEQFTHAIGGLFM